MRTTLIALAIAAALPAFSFAADAPESAHALTGNVSLTSEYIYRGIGQTNRAPAVQGGFDYSHTSGIYLGVWGSNISWLSDAASTTSASVELDFYGGYKGSIGEDFGYDVGVLEYYYPGTYAAGATRPYTTEVYVGGSYKFISAKYSRSLTNLFGATTPSGGNTKGSEYYDLTLSSEVGAGVTLSGHVGYQKVKDYKDASYTDWKLSASKEIAGLGFSVSYIGTDAKDAPGQFYYGGKGKELGADRVVVAVSKSF